MSVYFFIRTTTTYDAAIPPVASNQDDFNRNVSYAFSSLTGGYGEAGNIILRASLNAVPYHALCDGATISRRGFEQLFSIIGTSFGAGDGVSTFNLPTQAQIASGLAALVSAPPVPPQVIEGGSVSSGTTTAPPAATGGVTGGGVASGERPRRQTLKGNEQEI